MAEYRTKKPGDVLLLAEGTAGAGAGYYVLLDAYSDAVKLCRLAQNPETGDIVPSSETVQVGVADLCLFAPTGLSMDLDLDPLCHLSLSVQVGDILEPKIGASLPAGLYQVVAIEGDDVQVSRLHSNEDGRLATTSRLSWLARTELAMYRELTVGTELRP